MKFSVLSALAFVYAGIVAMAQGAPADYFAIHVVDEETGRGVPLVRLETTDHVEYFTDSNGYVAFNEPGLMNQETWFGISSHGYEYPNVAFGERGTALKPVAGGQAELKIHRNNIAERLYRITGRGIYRDTILLGKKPPIAEGALNAQVTGQDTVETAVYHGKLYWFWGDTNRASFHLGNFNTTGGTSLLPGKGGLDPSVGVDITYFTDAKGSFVKPMIPLDRAGSNPVWMGSPLVLKDNTGRERMIGDFARTSNLAPVERGMTVFNDEKNVFEPLKPIALNAPLGPGNKPVLATVDGKEYCYFGTSIRVAYNWESVTDLATYEGFTCLKDGASYTRQNPAIERDAAGKPVWKWRRGAAPLLPGQMDKLVSGGILSKDQVPIHLEDATGKAIRIQNGTITWNEFRKQWIMIVSEQGGDTMLGEAWYAQANAPEGPWVQARKVVTHAMKNNNQDFYNPSQHPEFAQEGGRLIYFEGTYTRTFSGTAHATPLYEYNQIMYRLDLADPRLKMPEPPAGWSRAKPLEYQP